MDRGPAVEGEAVDRRFAGEDGLRRLSAGVVIEVDDREGFRARVVRAGFASFVRIDELSTEGPVRAIRPRARRPGEPEVVAVHLVEEGRYRITGEDDAIRIDAGDAIVVDTRAAVRFSSTEPVRLIRVRTRLTDLPPYIRDRPPLPLGALPRTVLLGGYRTFLRSVLDRSADLPHHAPHLLHALEDLTIGVLAEASGSGPHARGAEGMRFRIKELIEQRLSDRGLSAVTIASALGVSARHVHQVFVPEGVTIAHYIEERRLRLIAAELRTRASPARSIELAPRYGFGGPDQLGRAFRRRYGVTLEEYRENSDRYRL